MHWLHDKNQEGLRSNFFFTVTGIVCSAALAGIPCSRGGDGLVACDIRLPAQMGGLILAFLCEHVRASK
jgi:hypothetical protein